MDLIDNQSIAVLKKYFIFDRIFDLTRYDLNNMYQLYLDLLPLKKENYESTYRFIFLHFDTEYYINKNYPGITLTNLQRILTELDISNYFCLILSQQDISSSLKLLQRSETVDLTAIDSLKYQYYFYTKKSLAHSTNFNTNINHHKILKKILCLNKHSRFHRRVLFAMLKENNLLDDSVVSYLGVPVTQDYSIKNTNEENLKNYNLCLLETSTNTRINDRWLITDEKIKDSIRKVSPEYTFKNFEELGNLNKKNQTLDISLSQSVFLHIVSETVYNYPSSFITEKSIIPILHKRPFVLVGPPGSIKNLQSLGFKTFNRWWNEDYDQIDNPEQRLIAILAVIQQIYSYSIQDLQNLCIDMQDVLNYNFNLYDNNFKQQQLANLDKFCQRNLLPRYD